MTTGEAVTTTRGGGGRGKKATAGQAAGPAIWNSKLITAAIFVVSLIPVYIAPVFPLVDFYDHLARYYVLSHIDHDPVLQQNYRAAWALLPNIGCDVIGAALLGVVSPQAAARIILTVIFGVQFGGIIVFNNKIGGRSSALVAILGAPLLYSFILTWGFANFLLGLGLVFWGAAWWVSSRDNLKVGLPVACVLSIVIFFTHGLAFALYGVLLGALEIGFFLQARRPRRLATLVGAMIPLLAQAIVPALLFALSATSGAKGGVTTAFDNAAKLAANGELASRMLELFQYRLTTIFRVEEGPSNWFDCLTFVLQCCILTFLVFSRRLKVAAVAIPAVALSALLVLFTPPALFGVGYVSDRMPLYAAMIVVGSVIAIFTFDRIARWSIAVLAIISLARLVMIGIQWMNYAPMYARFQAVADAIPRGSLVVDLRAGGQFPDSTTPRCEMYRPLLVALHHQVGALFAFETQQPLRMVGPLRSANDAVPPSHPAQRDQPGYYADVIARSKSEGFQYLFICNPNLLALPARSAPGVVLRNRDFALLRLR